MHYVRNLRAYKILRVGIIDRIKRAASKAAFNYHTVPHHVCKYLSLLLTFVSIN